MNDNKRARWVVFPKDMYPERKRAVVIREARPIKADHGVALVIDATAVGRGK